MLKKSIKKRVIIQGFEVQDNLLTGLGQIKKKKKIKEKWRTGKF